MRTTAKLCALIALTGILFFTTGTLTAQEIKQEKQLKSTEVKNQANSGTCWSFAVISLIESELIRMGKGEYDLSEIYSVYRAYPAKADRYMRLGGKANFSGGGQGHDVFNVIMKYGIVPEEAYSGLLKENAKHDHMEMDQVLYEIIKDVFGGNATVSSKWRFSVDSVLDVYIGKAPQTFELKGKTYTPKSFTAELGLRAEDYIELTSYSHHPFYQQFVLEVPDNWSQGSYYNVPVEDLMRIMENAIDKGFTFAWDGDVSGDVPFSKNDGIATLTNDSLTVTQEMRQLAFDDFTTTDDHLMHITGIGSDQKGFKYFLTKNSWGEKKGNKGYWWLSENYVRMNTIAIVIHKDALPADIAVKLGL